MNTNKKKKILYLITKSNFGGAQKYVYELACAAHDAGHDVIVAAGGTGEEGAATGLLFAKLHEKKVSVCTMRRFMRDISPWNDLLSFFEVHALISSERPDILHVTSSKAGLIGAFMGRVLGTPRIVFTSHGLTMDESWRPWWQRKAIALGTWLTLRLAHHNIMISFDTYKRTRGMPGMKDRVSLVFNGIKSTTLLSKKRALASILPELRQDIFIIGGVGELHPNKNWSAVIDALPSLPTHTHLVIIGTGQEYTKLKHLSEKQGVSERVHFVSVPEGAHQYMNIFDIFILSSHKEGLPYVLLEAGLAKRAVIASDLPGVRDIIENEKSGLLISPTPEGIVAAVQELSKHPEIRLSFGASLHKHVQKTFNMKEMIRMTFKVYNISSR